MGDRIPRSLSIMVLLLLPVVLVTGWSLWSLLWATPAPETAGVEGETAIIRPPGSPTAPSPSPTPPADPPQGWKSPKASSPKGDQDSWTAAPELVSQANLHALSSAHGQEASCPISTVGVPPSPPPAPAARPLHASVPTGSPTPTASPGAEPGPEILSGPNRNAIHGPLSPQPPEPSVPEASVAGLAIPPDEGTAEDERAEERLEDEEDTQEDRRGRHRRGSEDREDPPEPDEEESRGRRDHSDPEEDD